MSNPFQSLRDELDEEKRQADEQYRQKELARRAANRQKIQKRDEALLKYADMIKYTLNQFNESIHRNYLSLREFHCQDMSDPEWERLRCNFDRFSSPRWELAQQLSYDTDIQDYTWRTLLAVILVLNEDGSASHFLVERISYKDAGYPRPPKCFIEKQECYLEQEQLIKSLIQLYKETQA